MPIFRENPRGASRVRDWLRTNQGVGAVCTALVGVLLLYLQLSPWAHRKLRDGFTLGFFPLVGALLMLIFTVLLVLDSRRQDRVEGLAGMRWRMFAFCLAAVVGCWVYFELIVRVGFLIVSPFFLLVFMVSLGMRPWSSSLIAALAMTAIVYAVFRLIGIELPPGILAF